MRDVRAMGKREKSGLLRDRIVSYVRSCSSFLCFILNLRIGIPLGSLNLVDERAKKERRDLTGF